MKITVRLYKASSRVYGGVELGVLVPLAAALVQGHMDDGGRGVGYILQDL